MLVTRLDYAFQSLTGASLAFWIEMLTSGVIAEAILLISPARWA
jgi:hypothetical protein